MVRILLLSFLLLSLPAQGALLQISQYAFDDVTGDQITFRAYVDTQKATYDQVLRPYGDGVNIGHFGLLGVEIFNVTLDTGSHQYGAATGTWSFDGDLAQPITYDGYSSFSFSGVYWSSPEFRLQGRISEAEWASWGDDPLAGLLLSHVAGSKVTRVLDENFNWINRSQYGRDSIMEIIEVPEPLTIALFGVALLGVFARRRIRS